MSELDEAWAQMLAEAERRARGAGRGDVAEYLALRRTNDEARRIGIDWLLETFTQLAGDANRTGAALRIERTDEHRFQIGCSTMVGALLTLRAGSVRALRVEAGWPRTPTDGVVPGGGLARARIAHFGDAQANDELLLTRNPQSASAEGGDAHAGTPPQWISIGATGERAPFMVDRVNRHIMRLLQGG